MSGLYRFGFCGTPLLGFDFHRKVVFQWCAHTFQCSVRTFSGALTQQHRQRSTHYLCNAITPLCKRPFSVLKSATPFILHRGVYRCVCVAEGLSQPAGSANGWRRGGVTHPGSECGAQSYAGDWILVHHSKAELAWGLNRWLIPRKSGLEGQIVQFPFPVGPSSLMDFRMHQGRDSSVLVKFLCNRRAFVRYLGRGAEIPPTPRFPSGILTLQPWSTLL